MSGKRLNKNLRKNSSIEAKEKARNFHRKGAALIDYEGNPLKNVKFIYQKRLFSNYFIIPALFVLVSNLCFGVNEPSVIAGITLPLSIYVLGILLFVHHNERIRKNENPKEEDYELASYVMQQISYIAIIYAMLACATIIIFV